MYWRTQPSEPAAVAFGMLAQNVGRPIEVVVEVLEGANHRCKRLAVGELIRLALKHKEMKELEDRIAAIEERLEAR